MNDQQDTRALLRGLAIDRSAEAAAPAQTGVPVAGVAAAVLLAGVAAGAAVWFLKPVPATPAPSAAVADDAAQASAAAPARSGGLVASGFVVARRSATVAARTTGQVVFVGVEEGQRVRKGEVLARLNDDAAQASLSSAEAQLSSAKAAVASLTPTLADAERILKRTKSLAQSQFASTADLTRNEANVASLRAQLSQAQANLAAAQAAVQSARVTLDLHTIRAPFDGVVTEKNAQPGEIISPVSAGGGFTRTGICTIVDMGSLEIEVDVSEAFIARVRQGQKVDAVLDAYPDFVIPASVIATVPTANRDKATVRVRVAIDQRDPRILPEMAVKVTFLEDKS
ncbi:efflux RND transporter periplasmic adaptor subunit [Hankyongella ginsenosidimutans]|uniref:Efflux RND transporter periplasmic adaptor subunit n=1 Tax=Hankyongella ginsenosidimutans TaxID=1763828 RepID=A0A4D7C565_9SPHN|nr:efflux RND transporter periplasmic adaptor subunit [Hankyongella ginsenosidimutans]QCI80241.1 efflux RND transporter periplasmic adaptor subunit [Hankyongella ginsenosidimutans]